MQASDDKLAELVARLQKAVIGAELKRGRAERRARTAQPRRKAA
jgi:hypothetical protein